jgi:hypothetical protein
MALAMLAQRLLNDCDEREDGRFHINSFPGEQDFPNFIA